MLYLISVKKRHLLKKHFLGTETFFTFIFHNMYIYLKILEISFCESWLVILIMSPRPPPPPLPSPASSSSLPLPTVTLHPWPIVSPLPPPLSIFRWTPSTPSPPPRLSKFFPLTKVLMLHHWQTPVRHQLQGDVFSPKRVVNPPPSLYSCK